MVTKRIELKNGQVLVIREAQKKEAAEVLEYVEKIADETDFLTFGPGEFNMTIEQEEQFIEDNLSSANQIFLVAEIDGKIAGCLGFKAIERPRIRHTGELGCSVLKEYWGVGIGTKLVESLIEWAKTMGIIRKINLKVRPDNDRAFRLYEQFGFVREGLITREYFVDGKFYNSIFMGLQID